VKRGLGAKANGPTQRKRQSKGDAEVKSSDDSLIYRINMKKDSSNADTVTDLTPAEDVDPEEPFDARRGPYHRHAMLKGVEAGTADRDCSPISCDDPPPLQNMTLLRKMAAVNYHDMLISVQDKYICGNAVRPERVSEYISEQKYLESCTTIVMSKGQGDLDANAFDYQDGLKNFHSVCLSWAVAKAEHEHNSAAHIYDPVYYKYLGQYIMKTRVLIDDLSGMLFDLDLDYQEQQRLAAQGNSVTSRPPEPAINVDDVAVPPAYAGYQGTQLGAAMMENSKAVSEAIERQEFENLQRQIAEEEYPRIHAEAQLFPASTSQLPVAPSTPLAEMAKASRTPEPVIAAPAPAEISTPETVSTREPVNAPAHQRLTYNTFTHPNHKYKRAHR